MPPRELAATLENRSGLTGLTGTGDMREVLSRAVAGDARAVLGRDVYLHRLRASVAAMAAAMGGLDVLVFTGGVGENSPEVRSRAAGGLGFLGVAVDESRNTLDKAGARRRLGDHRAGRRRPHVRHRRPRGQADRRRGPLGAAAPVPVTRRLPASGPRGRR